MNLVFLVRINLIRKLTDEESKWRRFALWPEFDLESQTHQFPDINLSQGTLDRKERLDAMDTYLRARYGLVQ